MHLVCNYIHPRPRGGRCHVRVYLPEEERDAPVVMAGGRRMKAERSTHGALLGVVGNMSDLEDAR
jgi:hypothetical protein